MHVKYGNGAIPARFRHLQHLQVDIDGVTAEVALITPAFATELLERNKNIRPHRESEIAKYRASLEAGTFWLNGESIKLDRDGMLVDGQHRLAACQRSGVPFWAVVVYGVTQDGVDEGLRRSAAQLLSGKGVMNGNVAAAVAKILYMLDRGADPWVVNQPVDNATMVRFFESLDQERFERGMATARSTKLMVQSVTATAVYMMEAKAGQEETERFMRPLITGAGLEDGSLMLSLRQWLESDTFAMRKAQHGYTRRSARNQYVGLMRVWNAYRAGDVKKGRTFVWSRINDAAIPQVA